MPAVDLCNPADVAAALGVANDAAVARAVTAASRAVANYCGRRFERTTTTEYPTSYGRPHLVLERAPIVAVTSVSENGAELDPSLYSFAGKNAEAGMLYRLQGRWPDIAYTDGVVTELPAVREGRADVLAVTYDAGWSTPGQVLAGTYPSATLPEDVEEATLITAVAIHRGRSRDSNIAGEALGDWSVTYAGVNTAIGRGGPIPDQAQAMLAPYVHRGT